MCLVSVASAKPAGIVASKVRWSGTVEEGTVVSLPDSVLLDMSGEVASDPKGSVAVVADELLFAVFQDLGGVLRGGA